MKFSLTVKQNESDSSDQDSEGLCDGEELIPSIASLRQVLARDSRARAGRRINDSDSSDQDLKGLCDFEELLSSIASLRQSWPETPEPGLDQESTAVTRTQKANVMMRS